MKFKATLFSLLMASLSFAQDLVLSDYQFTVMFNNNNPTVIDRDKMSNLISSKSELRSLDNFEQFQQRANVASEYGFGNALYVFSRSKSGKDVDGDPDHLKKRRIALSFQSITNFESSYLRTFDADSITRVTQEYLIRGKQTFISGEYAQVYTTKPDKMVTFFVGYGASVGFSLSSRYEENFNVNTVVQTASGNQSTFSSEVNTLKGKINFGLSAFVPAGIHIQAYKNLGVLTELRFGGNYLQSAGGASRITPLFMFGLGMRYSFGKYVEKMTDDEMLY